MNIREFGKPITAKSLNESLAAKFGQKINLERFTLEQLQDVRNRLRTKLSQVETMESFDSVQNETYQKSKLMIDVLNAAIAERGYVEDDAVNETRRLKEGEEDKAEIVMAAKDMVEKLTGWMEDTAEMQAQSMLELADSIRDELGQEASEAFVNTVKPALDSLYSAMESTRTALTGGVTQITGEGEPTDTLGSDDELGDIDDVDAGMDGDIDADAEGPGGTGIDSIDMDLGVDDEFGAAAAGTGGEEPADRAKRESVERKKVSEISKKKAVAYINKAKPQKDAEDAKGRSFPGAVDGTGKKSSKLSQKRSKGLANAVDKIVGNARVKATESLNPMRLAAILSKKK
jgi:hypothetical protein